MIQRLLVANRGEIARRVFRTCRDLGIGTVAVHSDADADTLFVQEADVAVRLPGNTPAETYLRGDLVVQAALRAGADAVHPGYGFLSENAGFARAVIAAGLTWVGPDPESIEAMGSKVGAKKLMAAAGVPVLPDLTVDSATESDLPVLVKASAGGGGRGMRIARTLSELGDVVEQAAAEAESAFGDGTVFVEPYVERARHVEVQVFGDGNANISVLGDRDCSVQRRHQKVVEEAPAPGIPDEVRKALHEAARSAAETISYRGAGTVEFLYDDDSQRFFFLEMNTRLQVEHPVTELVTGTDLVALQIAAAEGGRAIALQVDRPHGHAVEVRLYAEDPAHDYRPQSGTLSRFEVPGVVAEFGPLPRAGIRLDSAVRAGDEIGTFYDAMVAKVIAWAPDRRDAVRRLAAALAAAEIHGLRTNRDLLVEVLRHPEVADGEPTTAFLAETDLTSLAAAPTAATDSLALAAFAAAVAVSRQARAGSPALGHAPVGWRNVYSAPVRDTFELSEGEVTVGWRRARDGDLLVEGDGDTVGAVVERAERRADHWLVVVRHDGLSLPHRVHLDDASVDVQGPHGHVALHRRPRFVDPADQVAEGSLLAPMPGSVVAVGCTQGEQVAAGQAVLVLEAMKMQHTITAPHDGTVTELLVDAGSQVNAGDVLAVVQAPDPGSDPPHDPSAPATDPTRVTETPGADA